MLLCPPKTLCLGCRYVSTKELDRMEEPASPPAMPLLFIADDDNNIIIMVQAPTMIICDARR